MSLARGTRLGPYEIVAPIGAGGMGEVYQARDTRLDRTVAIKILRDGIADTEHRARFEREAHLIAGLTHPHICTLHDVGEHDDCMFLVLEHVVGETLADRLKKGALPGDRAIEVAAQIAEALDAAHKQGIVHRDLKPANVMLTRSGVKLLDFGLAKLTTRPAAAALAGMTTLPPRTEAVTAHGVIVGTLQYMAPEQLEGKDADPRADVWALGAILYEMVSGRRAFNGSGPAEINAAILGREPPPLDPRQSHTLALEPLIRHCLAKDLDDRWASAHDVKLQLAALAHRPLDRSVAPVPSPRLWAVAIVSIAVVATLIGFATGRRVSQGEVRDRVVSRLVVSAPAGIAQMDSQSSVAISTDGRLIAFLGRAREKTQVFLRRLDSAEAVPIEGTVSALAPFFSPDNRWIGIIQDGKLKKVPIDGGTAQTIADAPSARGAVWRSDGTIFFAPSQTGPIFQVAADGGTPRPVTTLAAGENSHRFPQLLAGGDALLFTVRMGGDFDDAQVVIVRLSSGERKTLVHGGVHGRPLSTGHLVYAKGTTLMAAPFDAERLETLASPVVLLDDVRYGGNGGISDFAISDNGTLVYAPASLYSNPAEIVRVNRAGVSQRITEEQLPFRELSVSPNGRAIVASADNGAAVGLWIVDVARGTVRPLVRDHRNETPFWSPDGTRIIFSSNRRGPSNLFSLRLDRTESPQLIRASQEWSFVTSVTPDGRSALYSEVSAATGWDVWLQPLDVSGSARKLLGGSFHERHARLSPDGRAMAFNSDEFDRNEVYVVSYPIAGERLQVSTNGGTQPVWARSGHELFYRQDDALMVAPVDTAPRLSVGPSRALFKAAFKTSPLYALTYDVMPDDREFVAIRSIVAETARVNVVLNWFEELRHKVPSPTP